MIQNVIGCCFILQKKHGPSGEVMRYKAHLVAQGFSQQEGTNYLETFMPVVSGIIVSWGAQTTTLLCLQGSDTEEK